MSKRERFSVVETGSIRKQSLEERIKDLPEVRARFERMLDLIENAAGDVEKAAEAERRVTEELRQMGNDVLHGWARRQAQKKEDKFNSKEGVNRKEKKPLLVHAIRENRNRRTDFHPRARWRSDSAVFGIGRGGVSPLLDTIAADHYRLRCGRFVWPRSIGEAQGVLRD